MMNSDELRRVVYRVAALAIIAGGLAIRPVTAAEVQVVCTPNQVKVFQVRLHVRCDEAYEGVFFSPSPRPTRRTPRGS
jgi:hypothetical protein